MALGIDPAGTPPGNVPPTASSTGPSPASTSSCPRRAHGEAAPALASWRWLTCGRYLPLPSARTRSPGACVPSPSGLPSPLGLALALLWLAPAPERRTRLRCGRPRARMLPLAGFGILLLGRPPRAGRSPCASAELSCPFVPRSLVLAFGAGVPSGKLAAGAAAPASRAAGTRASRGSASDAILIAWPSRCTRRPCRRHHLGLAGSYASRPRAIAATRRRRRCKLRTAAPTSNTVSHVCRGPARAAVLRARAAARRRAGRAFLAAVRINLTSRRVTATWR